MQILFNYFLMYPYRCDKSNIIPPYFQRFLLKYFNRFNKRYFIFTKNNSND